MSTTGTKTTGTKIELWTLRHPEVEKGWIYLTEQQAKDALSLAEKKLKKTQPDIKLKDFIIEPYRVMDQEVFDILRETLPELFL